MEKTVTPAARNNTASWRRSVRTIAVILFLSAAVFAGHLLPGLGNSVIENGIRNALHILVFAIFAVLILESSGRSRIWWSYLATLVVIALVAGLSEVLQYSVGRKLDFSDVVRDLSGATLALACHSVWRLSQSRNVRKTLRVLLRAVSVLIGVMIVVPLLYWFSVIALSRLNSPAIISFDHWWEKHLYHAINTSIRTPVVFDDAHFQTGVAAELRLSGWGRSGLGIAPVVSDWSDYEYLTFVATLTDAARLSLRMAAITVQECPKNLARLVACGFRPDRRYDCRSVVILVQRYRAQPSELAGYY